MLAHAYDVALRVALVRGSCALSLALTELLHHSEVRFLGRRLERRPGWRHLDEPDLSQGCGCYWI